MFKLKKKGIPLVDLYSGKQSNQFNFLDISDLHVGNKAFQADKLHELLTKAVERNVDYVFIAGDLLEAVYDPCIYDFRIMNEQKTRQVEKYFRNQVYTLYRILRQYNLNYIAINGNHEYGFEQLGIWNPLKLLEEKLQRVGVNFQAYDTYLMDFQIAGVVKRMIHLESFYEKKTICHSMERLYEFERNGGLNVVMSDGDTIPVRFLTCGHVHLTMELYSARHNVFVAQPGSLIVCENAYEPGVFVRGEVTKEKNIIRY